MMLRHDICAGSSENGRFSAIVNRSKDRHEAGAGRHKQFNLMPRFYPISRSTPYRIESPEMGSFRRSEQMVWVYEGNI
jgi:hypothetical protein